MKKIISVFLILMLLVGCGEQSSKEYKVGVIQWENHPALDDSYKGMIKGLETSGVSGRVKVIHKVANGLAADADQIIDQFVGGKVDLIYAIATPAAQSALNAIEDTDIKMVFAAVTDPVEANLVDLDGTSSAVTGVSDAVPLGDHIDLMKEFNPELKRIGVLFKTSEANSLVQIRQLKDLAADHGVEIVDKGVNEHSDIPFAASELVDSVDAMHIITDNLITTAAGLIVDTANLKRVPVFMA